MDKILKIIIQLIFCLVLLFPSPCSSLPLCTDLRAPTSPRRRLSFCPYNNGKVCCNTSEDLQLQRRFVSMNISDPACASAVKSILCATCDPFSAKLFTVESGPRTIPILCNSTAGTAVASLSSPTNNSFCSTVWDACQNVLILNSPFAPALQTKATVPQNATATTLTDLWQSESDFCNAFGAASDENSVCFSGQPVSLNQSNALPPPQGMCLEKIDNGSYLNMVAHPDGSNRAFFSSQGGKIWLATIPDQESGNTMGIDESSPFIDLSDQVYRDPRFGMMGMAFHPNFATNGRLFASFTCDKEASPGCGGRCACNSDVGCDPSQLGSIDSDPHCRYHAVVVEYSANGTASTPATAERASPEQVRRIFTLGLPFTANHGGQILFGPEDRYMYIMMGDGGSKGDPYNFAQNKKSLLGKIMRVDVDNIPSQEEISRLGLWGNYSLPSDNPYTQDEDMEPEIWDQYEEVDIIYKGGNYGWRVYEGHIPFNPEQSPGGNTSANSIDPIFPAIGYNHSEINPLGSAAVAGGYFYRAQADPCMYGSYLYADLYGKHIWAAPETPENSGNFTPAEIPFTCASDSPIKCDPVVNSSLPALQLIFSFGQDNRRDIYLLTQSGVYRVVRPSRCSYTCSKEVVSPASSPPPARSLGHCPRPYSGLMLSVSAIFLFIGFFL